MADSQIQSDDKIKKLQGQVQDVTDVMEKNIELGNILNNVMSTIIEFFSATISVETIWLFLLKNFLFRTLEVFELLIII